MYWKCEAPQCYATKYVPFFGLIKNIELELELEALTGCDTVPASYGIGKPSAIIAASKHSFDKIGISQSTIPEIEEEAKNFMVTCYGSKPCQSMTECRQRMWGIKTGKTASSAPKALQPATNNRSSPFECIKSLFSALTLKCSLGDKSSWIWPYKLSFRSWWYKQSDDSTTTSPWSKNSRWLCPKHD